MKASEVLQLLKIRHRKDVFVSECKNGPTQITGSHSRLDAWVMPRSWTKPSLTGYEIKVTRSDFMRDDKWQNYLPMCNELYFACAPGVADPREMPEGVGLLVATKTGNRLLTKKKAQHRNIEFPEDVFRYVLMARARIQSGDFSIRDNGREFWAEWLKDKKLDFDFGRRVGKAIRQAVADGINHQKSENMNLRRKLERLEDIERFLIDNNIDFSSFNWRENLTGEIPVRIKNQLRSTMREMNQTKQAIEKILEA